MADWTDIQDPALDPDAPVTSELAYAFRDNPIAIAEGAVGAPYVGNFAPYNGSNVGGAGDGKIYDFSTDGAVSLVTTPTLVAGYDYKLIYDNLTRSSTAGSAFNMQSYRVGAASWSSAYGLISSIPSSTGIVLNGYTIVLSPLVARPFGSCFSVIDATLLVDGTVTPSVSADSDRYTSSQTRNAFRVGFNSGNINGGRIYLYRRKSYGW